MFSWNRTCYALFLTCVFPFVAFAAQWHVAVGGTGTGSAAAPFGSIQAAVGAAQPGDTILVAPGTYAERLATRRHGTVSAPITLRATSGRGSVIVTLYGEVLEVAHAYFVVEDMVFDSQYALDDVIDVNNAATGFVLRNSEVRRTTRDCIDIGRPSAVLIERSLIHHCLNAAGGRTDAHGVVAGAIADLTIRDTEIHSFSGDAVQLDPGRNAPGWGRLTIEGCLFWLQPLPQNANGFSAGTVPGENALDTKTLSSAPRGQVVVRDTVAFGFRNGLIGNMAAFNLKENIDAFLDGVTVYDSDIAFRTRGPGSNGGAWVRVQNAVVYNVERAIRYEDDIERLQIFNTTIGANVARTFQAASSGMAGLDVRNMLLLAGSKPLEAADASNLAVDATHFVNAAANDYQLVPASLAVDTGLTIAGVDTDRVGTPRPQGIAPDVGAYEVEVATVLPEVRIDDVAIVEPPTSAVARFAVRLSQPSTGVVSVVWATRSSSARAGRDFVAASGVLTFAAGETVQYAPVTVLGDALDEGSEGFDVVLSAPDAAIIADTTGRGRITDDDPPPTLSIVPSMTVVEGTSNTQISLQVSLSAPSGQTVKVAFATADVTARASLDYLAATGAVSFSAGTTTRTITLTVLADSRVELAEQFTVTLSNPTNATIGTGQSVVTIVAP